MNTNTMQVIRKTTKREQASMTNFGHADDRLSRCVSALMQCLRNWQKAADMDYYFDYGEWSGKACAEAMHKDALDIVERFNYESIDQVADAVQKVCDAKFAYNLGLFFIIQE